MAYNKNIVKRKFPLINIFYCEVIDMINAVRDLTVGVFEHLYITSSLDLYIRIKYTELIMSNADLKNIDKPCWYASICRGLFLGTSGISWQMRMLPWSCSGLG